MAEAKRIGMSFNTEQVQWTHKLFAMLQRGGDVRVVLSSKPVLGVLKTFTKANARTIGLEKPAASGRRTHCKFGHELVAENTYLYPEGKRACKTCRRDAAQVVRDRKRKARLIRLAAALARETAADAQLDALAEQRTG